MTCSSRYMVGLRKRLSVFITEEEIVRFKTFGYVAFIVVLLSLPIPANTQSASKVWRIGMFHVGLDHVPSSVPGLREGLKALGYEEGNNLHIDWHNLPDEAAAHVTAQSFVRESVDLIVALENQTIRAAQAATTAIPVVMVHAFDPVGNGFVHSLSRPGGNLTGQAAFSSEGWYAKRLELFTELVPTLRQVLVLVDPNDPLTPRLLPELQQSGTALQLQINVRRASTQAEIEEIFSTLSPDEVDGIFTASNNLETNFPSLILRHAMAQSLPMPVPLTKWVNEGGLFYYGINYRATGRAAARQVDKLFNGVSPAMLPVEQPATFDLVVNLKTAEQLDITIPPTVLYQATKIIQ